MFGTFTLMAFTAFVSVLVARADVIPIVPGPGVVYNEGGPCRTEWTGDTASKTVWKNTFIMLMSGSNWDMINVTYVATVDGTVDGFFEFPCPQVKPNSAIYFFQYSAPGSPTKQWTTRFAIASPKGETTPPSESNQPGTNEPIPWGKGALLDPSKALPLPGTIEPTSEPRDTAAGSTTPAPAPTPTTSAAPLIPTASGTLTLTSRFTTVFTSTPIAAAPTASANNVKANNVDNAAMAVTLDSHVWQTAVVLTASAMAFVALL